jgi:opacity protein-like surface antigen
MKSVPIGMVLASFLFGGAALAQNSDLAILLGTTGPFSSTVGHGTVADAFGAGFQLNYAAQLYETKAGQLYLELPLIITAQVRDTVGPNVVTNINDSVLFTPGVRWRFTPQKRVSFYAAAGVGVGSFGASNSFVGNGMVTNSGTRTYAAAFGFGGGIDFRLTRLLSLRAEGRDFVTGTGLGGSSGRNHAFFMAGIGFHF